MRVPLPVRRCERRGQANCLRCWEATSFSRQMHSSGSSISSPTMCRCGAAGGRGGELLDLLADNNANNHVPQTLEKLPREVVRFTRLAGPISASAAGAALPMAGADELLDLLTVNPFQVTISLFRTNHSVVEHGLSLTSYLDFPVQAPRCRWRASCWIQQHFR